MLEERRVPLFIWPRETDWDTLHETASRHPRLPVVLEQCEEEAYWNLRFLVPLLERCENVRVETGKAHLYLGVDEIVKRFGASRVIYGSNLPVDDPFASLMLVTDGDFSDGDKEKIARGNLETLIQGVKT
jgi:predicted TIM-barrel fold metal-dependent hydrolase